MGIFDYLLIAAACSILSLGLSGYVLVGTKAQDKQLQTRFQVIMSAYGRSLAAVRATRARQKPIAGAMVARLAKLIGYNVDEPYLYSTKWWVVVLVSLPPARLVCWILAGLLNDGAVLLTPVVWVLICRSVFSMMLQRYVNKLLTQFPDALGLIVRAVRVGIPVNVAIATAAQETPPETAREFQKAAEQLALGGSVEDAVAEMARQSRLAEYRFFATALSLQSQTGGGLSETLDNLADVIRKRVAMRSRGNALSGEAKMSAGILATLPIFTGAALLVITPSYADMLFNDAGGRRLLAIAVGLLCTGILVMRQMIRKSLT